MNYDSVPIIMPVSDFPNTEAVVEYAHQVNEPVFLTKEGRGDCVIMSMDTYERDKTLAALYAQIDEALDELDAGCELNPGSKIIEEMENRLKDAGV